MTDCRFEEIRARYLADKKAHPTALGSYSEDERSWYWRAESDGRHYRPSSILN